MLQSEETNNALLLLEVATVTSLAPAANRSTSQAGDLLVLLPVLVAVAVSTRPRPVSRARGLSPSPVTP